MVEKLKELDRIYGEEVLDAKQVCSILNISRSTLYKALKRDDGFPKPFSITPGRKHWKLSEIDSWVNGKMNGGQS